MKYWHYITWSISNHEEYVHQQKSEKIFKKNLKKKQKKQIRPRITNEWWYLVVDEFSATVTDLLYHDAVCAGELQASGEVKCVHPAQDKCKHHHRHIRFNARQVESSCDYNQYRVDETTGDGERNIVINDRKMHNLVAVDDLLYFVLIIEWI